MQKAKLRKNNAKEPQKAWLPRASHNSHRSLGPELIEDECRFRWVSFTRSKGMICGWHLIQRNVIDWTECLIHAHCQTVACVAGAHVHSHAAGFFNMLFM